MMLWGVGPEVRWRRKKIHENTFCCFAFLSLSCPLLDSETENVSLSAWARYEKTSCCFKYLKFLGRNRAPNNNWNNIGSKISLLETALGRNPDGSTKMDQLFLSIFSLHRRESNGSTSVGECEKFPGHKRLVECRKRNGKRNRIMLFCFDPR